MGKIITVKFSQNIIYYLEVKMSKLISKIFIFQELSREKIINNNALLNTSKKVFVASRIIFYLYILFFLLQLQITSTNITNWIYIIIVSVVFISGFISNIKNMCTSICDFLIMAFITTLIIGSIIHIFLSTYINVRDISYFLIIVIFTTIWTFFSTFTENKIGTLSNAILAVIVGISLQANSFIWSEKELALLKSNVCSTIREASLASYKVQELAINKVLFPLFVMTTIGALACAYKEYWLEKNEVRLNKLKDACKKVGKY